MPSFAEAAAVVQRGRDQGVYPAAVVEVGTRDGAVWTQAFGALDYDDESPAARVDTVFDLASLTKAIATASLMMRLVDSGRLSLTDRVADHLPEWRSKDREHVVLRSLLTHSAGLTAWLPYYRDYEGRRDFQHAICTGPLEYAPDTQSIYSDLGFMLLGFIIEDTGGAPMASQTNELLSGITDKPLLFNPPSPLRPIIAPTEHDPWRGRRLVGEVHDENCWALGGAAGHAGLFGSADAVGDFARAVLNALAGRSTVLATQETMRLFVKRAESWSSRALGWDTMLPTSSCGHRMSPSSFGHTGFTGTTLWIDPDREVYVVFLTNRVNPTRENIAIQAVRPMLHDAVMEAMA